MCGSIAIELIHLFFLRQAACSPVCDFHFEFTLATSLELCSATYVY
jgi:hypothetical protein